MDVSGFGDFKIVTFQRQLIWVRSASASVVMMRKGKVLRSMGNFNDHYGFLKSAESAVAEAKEMAAREEVGPGSEIQIVVSLDIVDEPAIFDVSPIAMDHMSTFPSQIAIRPVADSNERRHFAYSGTDDMAEWVKGDHESKFALYNKVPWVERVMLVSNQTLWDSSTQMGDTTADIGIATAIERHRTEAVSFAHELIAQRDDLLSKMRERMARMSAA